MARITKEPLPEAQRDALFTQLNKTIGKLSERQSNDFFSEFFGPEERIMLAKRLAIIVMLLEGHSLYKTARTLKVSTATAAKISNRLRNKRFARTVCLLKKNKKQYLEILDTLDSILHLGGFLPHRVGLDRYRAFKNLSID